MKDQVTQHASHFKGRGLLTFIKIPVIFFCCQPKCNHFITFFYKIKDQGNTSLFPTNYLDKQGERNLEKNQLCYL